MSARLSGEAGQAVIDPVSGAPTPLLDNKFQLVRRLATLEDEVIYEALHTGTGRRVRVHMLPVQVSDAKAASERMRRAARAAGRVPHSQVLSVLDSGHDPRGRPYVVYEYFADQTLLDLLAEGPLPPEQASRIICQLLDGLSAMHQRGVIHRCIRPEQVLVDRASDLRIKLTGFSFATVQGKFDDAPRLPRGYSRYAAPELRRNPEAGGPPVDIYAVGVLMRHLLTGDPAGSDGMEARAERAIERASSDDPDQRFTAAEHFLAAVSMLLPEESHAPELPADRLAADLRYMQQRSERESGVVLPPSGESRMELHPVLLMIEAVYARLRAAGWKLLCDELPDVEALLPGSGHEQQLKRDGVPALLVAKLLRAADVLGGQGDLAWLTEVGEALVKRGLRRFCPRMPAQLTPDGLIDCVPELWASMARHGEVIVLERTDTSARVAIRAQTAPSLEVCAVFAGLLRAQLRGLSGACEVSTIASQALGDAADIYVLNWQNEAR